MAKWGRKKFEPVSTEPSPRMGELTVGDYANGMPNIRLGEMFKSFGRQLPWVIILFAIGAVIAWIQTADFKRSYFGEGRILVQFSDDYAYNPVGQTGQPTGISQTIDTVTLTEAAIMKNGELIDEVIFKVGAARIAPEAHQKVVDAKSQREENIAKMELRNEVGDAYVVMPRPKSSIIDVRYEHENPELAVEVANAFIDIYKSSRSDVFDEGKEDIISERRQATEDQLGSNERAIARFLKKNNISDFGSEQEGLQERTEDLKASLNEARASISETEGALARVEDQLRGTAQTINLYRDDISAQRVAQAELELRQLLAKYLPTSDPVRQKQTELDELKGLQSSYGGKASGGRRVGPNPTHQALVTQRNNLAATADSLREREYTLQRQLNSADTKIRRLTALSPEYQNLLRERETLELRLTSYNAKEQEALVDALQAPEQVENVSVISYAKYPSKGPNMRLVMFVIASLAWAVILFFIAMIRVFLDPRLYAAPTTARRGRDVMVEAPGVAGGRRADDGMAPLHETIPEAVPAYDPGQPVAPNPYDVAAMNYADPVYQGQQSVEMQPASSRYDQYGRPISEPYVPPHAQPQVQAQAQPQAQSAYSHGSTALDLSHNPYATGEARAGAFEQTVYVDAYGNPIQPQSR